MKRFSKLRRIISPPFFILVIFTLLFHSIEIDAVAKPKIKRQPQTAYTRISGEVEFSVKVSGKK